ncbi:YdcF family protein [Rhodococcus maanshanensis]|uniref:YdcF family protein n=1 Tax=Rhodococcus maanshanensis TaxID=183556 RepID=UPI000B1E8C1A|nr:YdcF family protein [Rhodococcus maanshanensis]
MREHRPESGHARNRIRRLTAACLLLITVAIAGVPAYIHPQLDPLRPADAILVLGGPDDSRYPFGIELGLHGWAPTVVLSNPLGAEDDWMTQVCESPHRGIEVECFVPDPPTTRGEGRELRRLADQHGWHHVIVVTFTPHISRARFILHRCFDGELTMVASPGEVSVPRWAFEYAYQSVGYVRAVLQPGC